MTFIKTILLVEDQQMLVQLMNFELTDMGYQVVTANNGIEALSLLEKNKFDVMITDLFMPEMGGLELIEAIQQKASETNEMPIIVLSASRHEVVKAKLVALGVFNFIDKPITEEKIVLLQHLIESL